ncbi:MAG: trypsin-like peptidase domain-containing protein, partial [Vicinamibacteria bacterium]|nr:trypsin-like peptidase domain-containing protein [Vicinamibacteria bacterium]
MSPIGRIVILVQALLIGGAFMFVWAARARGTLGDGRSCPDFAEIVARANPSVVRIQTLERADGVASPDASGATTSPRRGEGAGFIVDPRGFVLTNNHLVSDSSRVRVGLSDGRELAARIVGQDASTDLALLKVEAGPLIPLPLGDSDRLRIGEWVCAIGNPLTFEHSVTVGVVSSKGRKIFDASFDAYIQTDAAINPGSSGGPLINTAGEAVGISSAVSRMGVGIGFAVPINVAREVMEQLRTKGSVSRGYLGIQLEDVGLDLAHFLGLPDAHGALVLDVLPGGAGDAAGLRRYDVIRAFAGGPVENSDALVRIVARKTPGSVIALKLLRDGRQLSVTAILGERQHEDVRQREDQDDAEDRSRRIGDALGLEVIDLPREIGGSIERGRGWRGVMVNEVNAFSIGSEGLERGDMIVELNRTPTPDTESYHRALAALTPGAPAWLFVFRSRLGAPALVRLDVEAR